MANSIMVGFWRFMIQVPPALWQKQIGHHRRQAEKRMAFMSADHRRVHHYAVREMPFRDAPLSPEKIAKALELAEGKVTALLDDLEKHMTFLFRDSNGDVLWAYPVTVEKTPHRVTFDTGEQIYAA